MHPLQPCERVPCASLRVPVAVTCVPHAALVCLARTVCWRGWPQPNTPQGRPGGIGGAGSLKRCDSRCCAAVHASAANL